MARGETEIGTYEWEQSFQYHRGMEIPHIDVTLTSENKSDVAWRVATKIRPYWRDRYSIENFSIGAVNQCLRMYCYFGGERDDEIALRTLSDLFYRQLPVYVQGLKFISDHDLGPKLLCTFENGVAMSFIKGQTLAWNDGNKAKAPAMSRKIARHLARHHSRRIFDEAKKAGISEEYGALFGATTEDRYYPIINGPEVPECYRNHLPDCRVVREEERQLMTALCRLEPEPAFCHLEVNVTNIIFTDKAEDGMVLIDHDYSSISYAVYDLAWFFSCFINPKDKSYELEYPTDEWQTYFLSKYLERRQELDGATTLRLETLMKQIRIARLLMLLRWVIAGPTLCRDLPKQFDQGFFDMALMSWNCYQKLKSEMHDVLAT